MITRRTPLLVLRLAYVTGRLLWEKSLDLLLAPRDLEITELTLSQPFCAKCCAQFEGVVSETHICSNCYDLDLKFRKARAAYPMIGSIREAIIRYKYHGEFWLRIPLAYILHRAYKEHFSDENYSAVVPIPLSIRRKHKRGFNQSAELAYLLSKKIHVPFRNYLLRNAETKKQTTLSRKQRIRNVRNKFTYVGPDLRGGQILLIDDVLTTGSTASACAAALLKANASAVDVLTIARA